MISSTKSLLSGLWIGAFITFGVTAFYLISNEQSINVPGEMGDVLAGVGVLLLVFFLLATILLFMLFQHQKTARLDE